MVYREISTVNEFKDLELTIKTLMSPREIPPKNCSAPHFITLPGKCRTFKV